MADPLYYAEGEYLRNVRSVVDFTEQPPPHQLAHQDIASEIADIVSSFSRFRSQTASGRAPLDSRAALKDAPRPAAPAIPTLSFCGTAWGFFTFTNIESWLPRRHVLRRRAHRRLPVVPELMRYTSRLLPQPGNFMRPFHSLNCYPRGQAMWWLSASIAG